MARSIVAHSTPRDRAAPPLWRGYRLIETAIGICGIAWSERGLTRLQLPEADPESTERRLRAGSETRAKPPRDIEHVVTALQRYCAGERIGFESVPLDLESVSPFYRRIYDQARRIAWGHTLTYGELGRLAGYPDAARAVGQAMGRNRIPIIVPCHRVLASGGKIGGFSAFGGPRTKERLLALEGIALGRGGGPLLPGLLSAR
ncbi:MAG TPA: methylated-DNA--[protein]-cysteine S-methyltransferase [Hyphomicrobiaceae bacterium]|nr:methylated-DNA--[protein]-cysteine S-methyltransferase [Hyphomicrobiaceae bacterium]